MERKKNSVSKVIENSFWSPVVFWKKDSGRQAGQSFNQNQEPQSQEGGKILL